MLAACEVRIAIMPSYSVACNSHGAAIFTRPFFCNNKFHDSGLYLLCVACRRGLGLPGQCLVFNVRNGRGALSCRACNTRQSLPGMRVTMPLPKLWGVVVALTVLTECVQPPPPRWVRLPHPSPNHPHPSPNHPHPHPTPTSTPTPTPTQAE
jgi:hypothetical protein